MRRRGLPALGLVLALGGGIVLSACGGSSGSASGNGDGSSAATITIQNFAFTPVHDTVSPGEKLTVTNKDSVTHTLTSLGGAFNTGDIGAGQSKTFTAPSKAGTYPYRCNIHQYMTGTLVVR